MEFNRVQYEKYNIAMITPQNTMQNPTKNTLKICHFTIRNISEYNVKFKRIQLNSSKDPN